MTEESIIAHRLSILKHGRCTICGEHLSQGVKVYAGVLKDGSFAISCEDCKESIVKTIKEYVYYPQETSLPKLETKLWRYQDFAKFVSLLDSRKLFFTRADSFEDPFEGARGFNFQKDAIYDKMKSFLTIKVWAAFKDRGIEKPTEAEFDEELTVELEAFMNEQEEKRKQYFISCWHSNERESEGMWKLYTTAMNQGVAIQTTAERLCRSIYHDEFEIAEVNYVSFSEPLKEEKTPIWYKRDAFAHENEVRVVIKDQMHKETGILVDVDLDILIENVYVSPTAPAWLADLVESVMLKYGISKPVKYSHLNDKPVY